VGRSPLDQPFVLGPLETPAGTLPRISATLSRRDRLDNLLVRCGVGRMRYLVEPGLYALHNPGPDSPVLVSANYKLSFDHLRCRLAGVDAWILVLDTDGINVWCAAGKGSFGSANLISQLAASRVAQVIRHRRLIVPQLGGPGINARLVEKNSGFKVLFGPVEAADLPVYLAAGLQATPAMRRKHFPLRERAVLIPVELVLSLKWLLPLLLLLAALFFLGGEGWSAFAALAAGGIMVAVLAGQALTPLLLPWLPGRAFAGKGLVAGLAGAALFLGVASGLGSPALSGLDYLAWLAVIGALASFLAMEFTGSSTYTSLSGVKKEIRLALPWQIGGGVAGLLLLLAGRWGGI
jgi:hypothetical protein